jgi:hypothetical protein
MISALVFCSAPHEYWQESIRIFARRRAKRPPEKFRGKINDQRLQNY